MLRQKSLHRISFLIFLFLIIVVSSIYILSIQSENIKNNIKISENAHIRLMSFSIQQELKEVVSDLTLLTADDEIKKYLNKPSKLNIKGVIDEFVGNSIVNKVYYKIRFIDEKGMEIIRVNYDKGETSITDESDLQDKSNRYYFKNTIKLDKGEIYISPIDLNIEHGKVVKPYKPVIRFCTPLFNNGGVKKGILVLSYLGDNISFIIGGVEHAMMLGTMMFIDTHGNFIISQDNKEKKIGFMFKDKPSITFAEYYPDAWDFISKSNEGSVHTDEGLFTYKTLSAFDLMEIGAASHLNRAEILKWKIISYISNDILNKRYKSSKNLIFGIDATLFLIIIFGTLWYLRIEKFRKIEKNRLIESEQWHRGIFEGSRDAIFIVDSNADFVDVNNAAVSLTGYSKEELLKMSIRDLHEEDDLEAYKKYFHKIINGESVRSEAKILKKDGVKIDTEFSSTRISIGSVSYMHTIARDITERKRLENEIKKSEEKYRNLIELAHEGIWVIDADAKTTFVNLSMAKMLGYTADEMIGKHLFSFMDEQGVKIAKENIERRKKGIKEQHDFEFIRKDGKRIYTVLATSPIMDEKGGYMGAIAGVIDITDRKLAEDELKRKNNELQIFYDAAVGRELKIIELKKEINSLLEKNGEKPKYETFA